jgi:hypothetical protein
VAVGAVDSVVDVVVDSVVDGAGSAFAEVVSDGDEEVVVVVGAEEVASDVVVDVKMVDGEGVEVGNVVEGVEVVEAAEVAEVVDGELVGSLVVVTVAEESAAVVPDVGETGAAVGFGAGVGRELVAEGMLEPGAAAGLTAVGRPVLGRTHGVGHLSGAMGDPPRSVREPATLNRLTWTWSR